MMLRLWDVYKLVSTVVPQYVTIIIAYAAVRRWGIFTPEQCAGLNRFVAMFAIPFLNFDYISGINLLSMDLPFLAADTLSKLIVLFALVAWSLLRSPSDWSITLFSLSTLPNTLLMGIPLLGAMYGGGQGALMVQVVVLQSIVWYTLLIFLFEYRAAASALRDRQPLAAVLVVGHGGHLQEKLAGACENGKQEVEELHGTAQTKLMRESGTIGFIFIMKVVGRKLVRNPNFHASVGGLCWALASARWKMKKPMIMEKSVTILSDCALGASMFSLGNFMALQPTFIACGKKTAVYGMLIRFIVGPAVMGIASLIVGIRGNTLKSSIIQAALPQGVVPFVFAREYGVHPEVLSTVVIFGMIISLPITMLYYVALELVIPNDGLASTAENYLCSSPSITKTIECYLSRSIRR